LIDQSVQTKQITSKEKSDWRLEQSILSDNQKLFSSELAQATFVKKEIESVLGIKNCRVERALR
jgi:hypothetical protein